ncbi:MAG: vWA domain-containing protein [Myxococcales bacterium]
MSEPNDAFASKSRRFLVSPRVAIPGGLVVVVGLGFAVAFQMGVFESPLAQEKVGALDEAGSAAREEGTLGSREVAEDDSNVNPADRKTVVAPSASAEIVDYHRSADLIAKDQVARSGLLALFGQEGVGGDIDGAIGNPFGSRADEAGMMGALASRGELGISGTGSGGGGLAGTVGIGGIGTKGRGVGTSAFGAGGVGFYRTTREVPAAEPLKAGATDDNAEFDKFVQFLLSWSDRGDTGVANLVDVRDRRYVRVVDAKGLPIPTASVRIVDERGQSATSGTTYGDGRVPFYPRAHRMSGEPTTYAVEASFGGQKARASWDGTKDLTLSFEADRAINGAIQLDVLFALDTTGSMSDEIDRIKATLLTVTDRLRGLTQKLDLRYGAVLFRDLGDDYVTRPIAFTSDVRTFMQTLQKVEAGGGGDEPESVNRALAEAVAAKWRPGAAKVVFLIGDAPPHMDYEGDVGYGQTMKAALAKGIRVHSIAASGLSALGTLVWRQVAQYTRGKFVFIEYGSAQATAAAHGVTGNFKSNNLDDILYQQIRDELKGWGRADRHPELVEGQQAAAPEPAGEKYAGPIQLHPRAK